jgi:hypothetical protein
MELKINKIEKYFLNNKNHSDFHKNINNLSPEDLKEIFKKTYIPKAKSHNELHHEVKYKKEWKYSGIGNKEFNDFVGLKGEALGHWESIRVNMPERSYETYPISKQIKNDLVGKDFGYDETCKDTSEQYQKYLQAHKVKFDVFII